MISLHGPPLQWLYNNERFSDITVVVTTADPETCRRHFFAGLGDSSTVSTFNEPAQGTGRATPRNRSSGTFLNEDVTPCCSGAHASSQEEPTLYPKNTNMSPPDSTRKPANQSCCNHHPTAGGLESLQTCQSQTQQHAAAAGQQVQQNQTGDEQCSRKDCVPLSDQECNKQDAECTTKETGRQVEGQQDADCTTKETGKQAEGQQGVQRSMTEAGQEVEGSSKEHYTAHAEQQHLADCQHQGAVESSTKAEEVQHRTVELHAHRMVLSSWSEYLEVLCNDHSFGALSAAGGQASGGQQQALAVLSVEEEEVEAAVCMVKIMYTNEIPPGTPRLDLLRLLYLADKFSAPRIRLLALTHLSASPTPFLSWTTAEQTLTIHLLPIITRDSSTILLNPSQAPSTARTLLPSILSTFNELETAWRHPALAAGFCHLPSETAAQILSSKELVVACENTVFVAALSWLRSNPGATTAERVAVFKTVHLLQLSPWFLSWALSLLPETRDLLTGKELQAITMLAVAPATDRAALASSVKFMAGQAWVEACLELRPCLQKLMQVMQNVQNLESAVQHWEGQQRHNPGWGRSSLEIVQKQLQNARQQLEGMQAMRYQWPVVEILLEDVMGAVDKVVEKAGAGGGGVAHTEWMQGGWMVGGVWYRPMVTVRAPGSKVMGWSVEVGLECVLHTPVLEMHTEAGRMLPVTASCAAVVKCGGGEKVVQGRSFGGALVTGHMCWSCSATVATVVVERVEEAAEKLRAKLMEHCVDGVVGQLYRKAEQRRYETRESCLPPLSVAGVSNVNTAVHMEVYGVE